MFDRFHRRINYVRISVTDRCNLRCRYCMPEGGISWKAHEEILSYEEILRIVRVLASLGITKVRLTGGEPLIRKDLASFIEELKKVPGIKRTAVTTNGLLLKKELPALEAAGLDGINLSIDSLDSRIFQKIARSPKALDVRESLVALLESRIRYKKINVVPIQGVNEGELVQLAQLAKDHLVDVRFIELMPMGFARASGLVGIPLERVREKVRMAFGEPKPVKRREDDGPATLCTYPGFIGRLGFIDAVENKFCHACNRVRLTADGFLKPCLASGECIDLRTRMRDGATEKELKEVIVSQIYAKPREHAFIECGADETRSMAQIGG